MRLPVLQDIPPIDAEWTRERLTEAARALARAIEGEVRFGAHDRMLYATDASLYQVEPLGVVIPAGVEDALRAARACLELGLPILPRGGGTSLAGQCTNRAVVIDFSPTCRGVGEVALASGGGEACVAVEPGVTVDELNEHLASSGWFFAPDPATSRHANIAGCIGNNAAGARSILYGRTSENVEWIDALLGDGTRTRVGPAGADSIRAAEVGLAVADVVARHAGLIRERFPRTIRRNAGYGLDMILAQLDRGVAPECLNLVPLLCGSEGTLAITLGAGLRLRRLPRARGLAVVAFATLDKAIEAVTPILGTGPSAVELLDDTVISLARANAEYARSVELLPRPPGAPVAAVLYVEYSASADASELSDRFAGLARVLPGAAVQTHTAAASMAMAWKLRKAGEPLLHGVPGRRKPITFVEDNAVPVERLAEFVKRFRAIVESHGTRAAFYAHASVGVLHVRPLIDIHDLRDRAVMRAIAVEVADLARELGGVMSGEHGDGRVRSPLLERFYGPELMGAFREIKRAFDPRGLLNPGNIVGAPGGPGGTLELPPVESITERLRVRPHGRDARIGSVPTYYDYTDQHGFDGAVEMCNGAGICRKKQGGVMCPSYMATLDERHSTRGRGNALRLAITGQVPGGGAGPAWDDPETMATLDLCLGCKACKTECPSNVDIARLKSEYTAQRFRGSGGSPLATLAVAHVRALNAAASRAPILANAFLGSSLGKWALRRVLGVDERRTMPPAARALGRQLPRSVARRPESLARGSPSVVIFGDCFTSFSEPGIGLDAARVLGAFGYSVGYANAGCCARAMISSGVLDAAIETIERTLPALEAWASHPDVRAIVVLEPSCLSAIRDDWLKLRCRTPLDARARVADRCVLIEQFLERHWDAHPRRPSFRAGARGVLHGHCHQRALWGVESSAGVLRRVLGGNLETPDTTCCGMAGAFGFDARRYDLSMAIGELGVLPAARRASGGGATMLAPGASCRHQIREGAGVRAVHPVELLAELLSDS